MYIFDLTMNLSTNVGKLDGLIYQTYSPDLVLINYCIRIFFLETLLIWSPSNYQKFEILFVEIRFPDAIHISQKGIVETLTKDFKGKDSKNHSGPGQLLLQYIPCFMNYLSNSYLCAGHYQDFYLS